MEQRQIQDKHIVALQQNSPLGKILAAGLANRHRDRDVIKESIEDTGRHVVHELDRFIGALGTIASLSPLMGLLGTVLGMMAAFAKLAGGSGKAVDPQSLASDISFALITTAIGLFITIPCLLVTAKIGIMLRNFESMITVGLNRFLDALAIAQRQMPAQRR